MRRITFYGLLFLVSYGLLRVGCIEGAVSPDRLAVLYAGVLVPLALALTLVVAVLIFGGLALARRVSWPHVRWYFVDGWLASALVLALVLALLTIPLRNTMQLGSVGVVRLLVDRAIPKGVAAPQREAAWRVFERFWTGRFLPAVASKNTPDWERAMELLDDFLVAFGDGIQPGELERLEREVEAVLPPAR
ncbi:MAG: hypothetical protein HYT87_05825 [Nitrospirae bacterium]|nr:hypothetical protein [Nitrospirota bacterium]